MASRDVVEPYDQENGEMQCGSSSEEQRELLEQDPKSTEKNANSGSCWVHFTCVAQFLLDLVFSVIFWYVVVFLYVPDEVFYATLVFIVVLAISWRVYFWYTRSAADGKVPYTCGFVELDGKQLYVVATIHISPRAPKDVEAVVTSTRPEVAMIELDEERLDRMREEDENAHREPRKEDLQPVTITLSSDSQPLEVYSQRAAWNAEWVGEVIDAGVLYDELNKHGMQASAEGCRGKFALVERGGPSDEFVPYAMKASNAAKGAAGAVLVINNTNKLPCSRLGAEAELAKDLRVMCMTRNCGFPPVPVLLLPKSEGERLKEHWSTAIVSLTVVRDDYPRRTMRRRLCQACALMLSGIGILYGIIQCFSVEVGAEFLAAEIAARKQGIPCVCIDVDLNKFWSRLASAVVPTPCNLANSLLSWLVFPRTLVRAIFPPRGNVDVIGSMALHAISFPLRNWVAFLLAGACASMVTSRILQLFGYGAELAAEETGAISEENRDVAQAYIMLGVEMYLLPQIYDAVAASRDEAMYQSIKAKVREYGVKTIVVVVGAGHANGILNRARTLGF